MEKDTNINRPTWTDVRSDWTKAQVRAVVKLYNHLLLCQVNQEPFNKSALVRACAVKTGLSKGQIESKLMVISQARYARGLPWLKGFKAQTAIIDEALKGVN